MESKDKKFIGFTLAIYSLVVLFTQFFHEIWADEGQGWLIARDLSIPQIFAIEHFEGAPAFWHLLLTPFAKLGAPATVMGGITATLSILSIYLFLRYSPFSREVKLAFTFSYFIFYEFAIISRNYTLSLLFFFLTATLYPSRFAKPLRFGLVVALLANTNAHSMLIAAVIGAVYLYESWKQGALAKHKAAIITMALGGLIAIMQIIPSPDNFVVEMAPDPLRSLEILSLSTLTSSMFPKALSPVIFLGFFLLMLLSIAQKRKAATILFGGTTLLWVMFTKIPVEATLNHGGAWLIFLIFCLWIAAYEKTTPFHHPWLKSIPWGDIQRIAKGALLVALVISVLFGSKEIIREWQDPFSNSQAMAAYIDKNIPSDMPIVVFSGWRGLGILAYLPDRQFWYPETGSFGTFITLNKSFKSEEIAITNNIFAEHSIKRITERINTHYDGIKPLILFNWEIANSEALGMTLIHKEDSPAVRFNERYYLYRMAESY